MKLHLSTFLLLSIAFTSLKAKEIPAYYIRNNRDSVKIYVKNPFGLLFVSTALEKFQISVSYRDSLKGEKKILSPDSIREFGFHYKGENIRMRAFKNSMEYVHGFGTPPPYLFLDLVRDGDMQLVAYYQSASIPNGGGSIPRATYCYIPQEKNPLK